jgi:protein-disulfide isomerase
MAADREDASLGLLSPAVGETDHVMGPASAPLTLVEYGDYECSACMNALPIVQELLRRKGDGLRFAFRHFPQSSIHPHASAAAQAAEAAAAQGKFWEMHETLFRNQQRLGEVDFIHLGLNLGLEIYRFRADMERETVKQRIRVDHESGLASGVRRTPTFFINGRRYDGPLQLEPLVAALEQAGSVEGKQ